MTKQIHFDINKNSKYYNSKIKHLLIHQWTKLFQNVCTFNGKVYPALMLKGLVDLLEIKA